MSAGGWFSGLPLELREFNQEGRKLALEAVDQAFAKLSGTPHEKLIEARRRPRSFHEALARRRKALRAGVPAERLEALASQKRQLEELQAQLLPRPAIVGPAYSSSK